METQASSALAVGAFSLSKRILEMLQNDVI